MNNLGSIDTNLKVQDMEIDQYGELWGDEAEKVPLVLKPKKGSVIPPRRKLVKKMVLDSIVGSVVSLFQSLFFWLKANDARIQPCQAIVANMEMEIDQYGEICGAEMEKLPLLFKPKKGGVIPPKRKLVKKMVFDSIVASIVSLFRSLASCFKPNNANIRPC
ncbi:hypothetical protein Cgig2_004796 [Carnegiea gigantea]|uniref:Uncharacterized protein n=1 Tax=Carnegiea gigantea TaxID=171969 RepID=A0A9Q1KWS9_9CARY|nr:hypothetical protein Cgig2_004796 [Carnegiea gigantea]